MSGRPSTSSDICCERSPRATAPSTRLASAIGCVRSSMRRLTASSLSPHDPGACTSARWPSRPSCPTTVEIRSNSRSMRASIATSSLNASAMSASMPSHEFGSFTVKSPRATARSAFSSWRFVASRGPACPFVDGDGFPFAFGFPAASAAAEGMRDFSWGRCATKWPNGRTLRIGIYGRETAPSNEQATRRPRAQNECAGMLDVRIGGARRYRATEGYSAYASEV